MDITAMALVFLGGGGGAALRHAVHHLCKPWCESFPWHTLAINVAGSFLLGVLAVQCKPHSAWYLLLGVGLCGGFTTFSTFSLEVVKLVEEGRTPAAIVYATVSVFAAVAGAWLGLKAA
jgi:fluoride exporter